MFEWAKRVLGFKESQAARAIIAWLGGQPKWTPVNYENLARHGYMQNVYVFASIRHITMACAGIPWQLFQAGKDLTEIDEHPLLDLIRRPNPFMGGGQFTENAVGYLMLAGNSYIERVGPNGNRPPLELYPLRPDRTKVIPGDTSQRIRGYEYDFGGIKTQWEAQYILHLQTFNPLDDWYGMSPIQAAARSIDQHNEAKKWNVALLQNSAVPSGVMTTEGNLDDKQYTRLQTQIDDRYSGAKNSGRPMLLEGGLTWQEMGINPKDMNWLQGQKLSSREIAIAFGVPPELVGDTESKTRANWAEARKSLYMETILPLMDWYRDELNHWLVPLYNDKLKLDYDRDSIEALAEDRDKVWARVANSWWLKLNEARQATGYDEDPEYGDMYGWELTVAAVKPPMPIGQAPGAGSNPDGAAKSADIFPPSVKSFRDIQTAEQKAEYWKAFDGRRDKWYGSIRAQVAKRFKAELKVVKESIKEKKDAIPENKIDWNKIDAALKTQQKEWGKLLKATYVAVGEDFAKQVSLGLVDTPQPLDWWQTFVTGWLKKNSAEKVTSITDTTRQQIRDELSAGVARGEAIPQLAKRLDGLYLEKIIPWRSEVIARTEVINCSNLASYQAAKQTGLTLKREWIATMDARVRPAHLAANGQVKAMDEPYTVGGEKLMYPGDPAGSAGNTIQCRCSEIYLPQE